MYYDPAATGERIQTLRKNRKVTQEQLAIELNISDRYMRNPHFTIDFETAKRYREANKDAPPVPPCSVDRPDRGGVSVMVLESSSVLNSIYLIHEQTNKAHRQN